MGTDIYLYKTNPDFDKNNPEAYLRAGIFQEKENGLLRMIFPDEYWVEELDKRTGYGKSKRYKFTKEGLEVLSKVGKHYENSVVCGADFKKFSFPFKDQIFQGCTLVNQPGIENNLEFLEQVFAFYRKGLELEIKGFNPEVYINW